MTDNTEKVDLLSMTPDEVAEFLSSLGEPKYRAKQIFGWMHRGEDFDGMTNISKKLRETLKEKGYNPINQIVGYILSEDPTYITTHNNARNLIRKIDRDTLLQSLVKYYLSA